MNMTYSINKDLRVVYCSYTGSPEFDEWANTMQSVFRDPAFEPGFSFLMDRRLATIAPTTDYIELIAAFTQEHKAELCNSRVAIVVSEISSYGMVRMAQGLIGDTEYTQVFTDVEKAKKWLRSQS
jgi:hypothetical protein